MENFRVLTLLSWLNTQRRWAVDGIRVTGRSITYPTFALEIVIQTILYPAIKKKFNNQSQICISPEKEISESHFLKPHGDDLEPVFNFFHSESQSTESDDVYR